MLSPSDKNAYFLVGLKVALPVNNFQVKEAGRLAG